MATVQSIHFIGRQIDNLIHQGLTVPNVTHTSIEIDYTNNTKRVFETGPTNSNGPNFGYVVPKDYGAESRTLFDVSISASNGTLSPNENLDQVAQRLEQGAYDSARQPIYYGGLLSNSNSWASGDLQYSGVNLNAVKDEIGRQAPDSLTPGFNNPLPTSNFDRYFVVDGRGADGSPLLDAASGDAFANGTADTNSYANDSASIRARSNFPNNAEIGAGLVQANRMFGDVQGIARGGAGTPLGLVDFGATALGDRSPLGRDLVAINGDLGSASGIYSTITDFQHPTVESGLTDSAQLASSLLGPTSALGAEIGAAATGFGAAFGVVAGFQQGGPIGGLESAASIETLAPLVGLSGGLALPIAVGVGLVAAIFGGHRDNPANMPDKYDTQRYGQEVADLHGTNGANGQNFVEDAHLKTVLGGRTGISAIEETLAQYGSAANAPTWLAGMFDKLKGMFGMSGTGSGALNFEHAIKNEWVSGAQGTSGQHYTYTDLAQALYDFTNAEASAGAASPPAASSAAPLTAPLSTASRAYTMPVARRTVDEGSPTASVVAPLVSQKADTFDPASSRNAWASEPRYKNLREALAL